MLKTVGFRNVQVVYRDSLARRVSRAVKHKIRDHKLFLRHGVQQGRMVFHAWR